MDIAKTIEDTWRPALEMALKDGQRIVRLELTNEQLLSLEDSIQATIMSKAKAQTLVTQRPNFEWWTMAGLWPRGDEGWTVLLRRVPIQVNVQQMPMPPALVKS
jgi:hypothetical protein